MGKKIALRPKRRIKKITVSQFYEICRKDRSLIDELFENLEGALKQRDLELYEQCYEQIRDLIEKHKNSEWLDRIKKEIEDGIWKVLPIYVTKAVLKPPCPWGGCPPPIVK